MPPKGSTWLSQIDTSMASKPLGLILKSPNMEILMDVLGQDAVLRYKAKVAKRSGALERSAQSKPRIGGHKMDRWIGVMSFGAHGLPAGIWHSKRNPNPNDLFFYGVLHEAGAKHPPSGGDFPAHNDGKAVRDSMVGGA